MDPPLSRLAMHAPPLSRSPSPCPSAPARLVLLLVFHHSVAQLVLLAESKEGVRDLGLGLGLDRERFVSRIRLKLRLGFDFFIWLGLWLGVFDASVGFGVRIPS